MRGQLQRVFAGRVALIASSCGYRYDGYKEKVSIGRFQKKLTQFGIRAVQDIFELFDG